MITAAGIASRVLGVLWRAVSWPFSSLRRILALGWLLGISVAGTVSLASADTGMMPGPDLANGSAQTVFEQAPMFGYGIPVAVPPTMAWPEQAMWAVINLFAWLLEMVCAVLVRGALVLMQWMLDLTLFRDTAGKIDTATQGLGAAVFWPLIGCTVASAGFTLYVKSKTDGRGSILGEFVKIAVLTILAITLVTAPSRVIGPLDDARTAASNAIMTGYSSDNLTAGGAVAGFSPVPVSGPNAASRTLADSMWSTFVLTPWCYTAFGGEDLCRQWGQDYITNSTKWQQYASTSTLADVTNGLAPGTLPDVCKATFGDACDTVRGVTLNRLGSAMVGAIIAIPMAILLLILAGFGLVAAVAVLLLVLMAPVFVVAWMVPGIPRQIGLKWFQALLGSLITSALIVALLGGVMVLGGILQSMIPTYGFWAVGVLNLAVIVTALKLRGMFENLIGMAHPGSSLASSYVAMKTLGALGRMGKRVGHAGAGAVGMGARGAAAAARHGEGGFMNAGGKGLPQTTAATRGGKLRQHFAIPAPMKSSDRLDSGAPSAASARNEQTALPVGSRPPSGHTPPQWHARAGEGGPDRSLPYVPSSTHTAHTPPQYNARAGEGGPGRELGSGHQAPINPRPAQRQIGSKAHRMTVQPTPRRDLPPREHSLPASMHYGAASPTAVTRAGTPPRPRAIEAANRKAIEPVKVRQPVKPAGGFGQAATRSTRPGRSTSDPLSGGRFTMRPKDGGK